tara:strand:+ start:105 stop:803 length:699 start_codon:yes stop_codon:yes gene_type:complete
MKNTFDWGPFVSRASASELEQETFIKKIYERMFPVERGDIVVDMGASVGPFAYNILPNEPSRVFCVEPSKDLLPFLMKNVGHECVVIDKGISRRDGEPSDSKVFLMNSATEVAVDTIAFQTFIKSNKITTIDFFKTDCEGAEYDIFNTQNLEWIKTNVKKIAGEWHLSTPLLKEKFVQFKNDFLPHFAYEVYSVDGADIKWDIDNQHFIDYYTEVLFYIDNRKPKFTTIKQK